jgi:hypothetical protein
VTETTALPSPTTRASNRARSFDVALAVVLGLGALLLYVATLAPTVLWGDDAYFQRTAFTGELRPDGGGHWLWLQAAQFLVHLPWGAVATGDSAVVDIAYRANLLSAIAAAGTIALLYLALRAAHISRQGAIAASLSLVVSHTLWMHAVRAEVYTLFALLLMLHFLLWFLWKRRRAWPLIAAAALFGLTLLGHQMALLLLPAWAFLLWRRRAWLQGRQWAITVAALVLGLLPFFAVLRLQIMLPTGASWLGALRLYFTHAGADFSGALFDFSPAALPRDAVMWLALLVLQFVGPALLLIVWGIWEQRFRRSPAADEQTQPPRPGQNGGRLRPRRRTNNAWTALLIFYTINVLFAFSYRVNDRFVFFLPGYLALALFVGAGWDALRRWLAARRQPDAALFIWPLLGLLLLTPALTYFATPRLLATLDLNPLNVRELPGRDPNRFFLWPPKHDEWGARDYAESALEALPQAGVLVADHTPLEPLLFLQEVEGLRPDVRLIKIEPGDDLSPILDKYSPDIPVFLADENPDYYAWQEIPGASLEQVRVVWRLEN